MKMENPVKQVTYKAMHWAKKVFGKTAVSLERPIFIWGTARCGTHLLYDLLSLHSELCYFSTDKRWKKGIWGELHYGDTTPEALKGHPIPVEGFLQVWAKAGVPDKIYGSCQTHLADSLDPTFICSQYQGIKTTLASGRMYRLIDKCPTYIMFADVIDRFFPDAYHIFCIRDPRAVVNSILRLVRITSQDNVGKEYHDGFFAHIYPDGYERFVDRHLVETVCWQIAQLLEIGHGFKALLGDRLVFFQYESLLDSVEHSVRYLYEKLNLKEEFTYLQYLPKAFPDYSPSFPGADHTVPDMEIAYTYAERPYLDALTDVAERFGYNARRIGQIDKSFLKGYTV